MLVFVNEVITATVDEIQVHEWESETDKEILNNIAALYHNAKSLMEQYNCTCYEYHKDGNKYLFIR